MSKFKKKGGNELPPISTASLPDIVFMLLFFFMVSTTMREVTLKVNVHLPEATELSKLEKKSLVSYIYVGEPIKQYQKVFGVAPRIQLNDQFANMGDIQDYIIAEREARDEAEQPFMITSLKVDDNTKMGIVSEIKQELRKSAALHINYSSRRRVER
ncbi:MAG: biopolymer transporter ExbD [Prolixibacteraceae bacterium]|jgi:biopolymer transport protein ExbD|nr:biopolymer transporter ExbD [Prolixibacteraceae bacterium]MBT6007508.1 biopolymer transporter ExbD [Prolixibacteraceae bacterium]MBT6763966.1 biopolymer transporter ExbD [Prolixibacteraceae bacterium]MBT6999999.1 biopolymer transporter ExbD [Prolixibacteraceae bacterium]MBT7395475.1 biopolymer transporter ExbD [Prolixibacteraceae bacterium]